MIPTHPIYPIDILTPITPVSLGVSGGKDSTAMAHAVVAALDRCDHTGPRLLIHSDLGRVEWKHSLPLCEQLAARLGLELVVVRRAAGDLMDRWWTRWANNVARYADLRCVKLILPWSTAAMRFCTSELKTAIICRDLVRRFPYHTILSASGIRRDESSRRAQAPLIKTQPRLTSATHQTCGYDWHPILDWSTQDIWDYHAQHNLPIHPAYQIYGTSRVSCAFCMLASQADLRNATTCPENAAIYREQVDLELTSTFRFQSGRWLCDVAPHLLTPTQLAAVPDAKRRAAQREAAEATIPPHLHYTRGWPTSMPTWSEAVLLSQVRQAVAATVGLQIMYTTPESILARYADLIAQRERKTNA